MQTGQWIRKQSKQKVTICEEEGVPFLRFPLIEQTNLVKHGFSTRFGGVSKGIFLTMNLSFGRGDEEADVKENYERMAKALHTDTKNMVLSKQTHTANVRVVTRKDCGKGLHVPCDYIDVDALVTNEPGVMLVTFYADCVPIYLVDTKNRAIALCHSGWRGTVQKISQCALDVMKKQYGTMPEDVAAAIGPSICQDCYEVSGDVVQEFEHAFGSEKQADLARKKENGKYLLDLWKANEIILEEAGVQKDRIQTTDLCTCCNPGLFFSHRATNGQRGGMAAFMELI